MALHVIHCDADGRMWQSFEAASASPLPEGFSQPAGHSIKTFAGPPAAGLVWNAPTLDFVAAIVGEKGAAKAQIDADEFSHRLAIRALALVMMDEINNVRTNPLAILSARTASQIKTALKNKVDTF